MAPHFYNKDEELETAINVTDLKKKKRAPRSGGSQNRSASNKSTPAPASSPPARRSPELLR